MWYPAAVTVAASTEPVSLAQAQKQVESEFADDTDLLTRLIRAARSHVEKRTNSRLATQTVAVRCDCFDDFERFPEAPAQSISSITYVDTDGVTQTLAASVYELRADGLEVSIVLKPEQVWPSTQENSRITVTAVVGYTAAPDDLVLALLLHIASNFDHRENTIPEEGLSAIDALLSNHIHGA